MTKKYYNVGDKIDLNINKNVERVNYRYLWCAIPVSIVLFYNSYKSDKVCKYENTEQESEKTRIDYMNDLSFRESRNDWTITNRYGYCGLYQIGEQSLRDLKRVRGNKYKNVNLSKFIQTSRKLHALRKHKKYKTSKGNSLHLSLITEVESELNNIFPVELQNDAIVDLLRLNRKYLGDMDKYIGRTVDGIEITESGLLASAHLVGARAVTNYLDGKTLFMPKDGNDVKFTVYLKKFQN